VFDPKPSEFALENAIPPALKNVVQRFWQVDRRGGDFIRETIIPKGNLEIIFNLQEDLLPAVIGSRDCRIPRCFVSGFHTVPVHLMIPGKQLFFGVYVNATALRKIFQIKGKDFTNQCIDLTLVDASMNMLWHQLAEQKTFDQRMAVFTAWALKRLPDTSKHERLFDEFLSGPLSRSASVDEVSSMLCYSPRHLSRKLFELTAMNLEQTLIYKRYLRAVDLMHQSQLLLTEIAHACDFADQSHFTKTFRSYAHMKPSEYRAAKSRVSGHIFENVR
jgi:AraC-like DNA-binding protein